MNIEQTGTNVPTSGPPTTRSRGKRRWELTQVTPPGLKPWDRTLSYTDQRVFEECELAYKKRKEGERRAPRELHDIVGEITHRASAQGEGAVREDDLVRQLDRLPKPVREEAERIVRELLDNDDELREAAEEVHEEQKDKLLLRCKAPVPHWELVAKPDETGMVDGGRGRDVLQLVEKKTSFKLRKKNKDQVFFAGMVAQVGRALEYEGPIKLVIRLLRSKEEHVFWYSRSATDRNMFRIASVIRRIEAAVESGDFKPNLGPHCNSCPYRNNCTAFAALKHTQSMIEIGEQRQFVAVTLPERTHTLPMAVGE